MTNNQRLRALIEKHGLTRREVCALTRSKKSRVDAWLAPPDADWHRNMPDASLELLEIKLEKKPKKQEKGYVGISE